LVNCSDKAGNEAKSEVRTINIDITAPSISLPDYYEAIFSNANASGNYSYRIYAIDVAGNANVSESKYFFAYDTYYVKVYPDHSIYNKRETAIFRVEVENVNLEKVSGFNLTLTINKNGTLETLFKDQITDEGRYTIKAEDPPGKDLSVTYWIYANVSKNGNRGFANNSFLVSKVLNLDFIYPPKGVTTHIDPGSPFNISIRLTNARGEIVEGAAAVAYCGVPECPIRTVGLIFNEVTKNYIAFGIMRAPNITDFDFIVAAIFIILSNYFVTQVALPYYRLGKEIKKLVEEEKSLVASRVEIEKQYFLRKIDEKTFFTLMADKQGKILRARADIARKREERKKLLIAKLHPKTIALWFKSNAIEFAIYLKTIPGKVYEKIKVKEIKIEKPKVPEAEVPKLPKAKILREFRYQLCKLKRKMARIKLPSIELQKVKVPGKVSREIKYRIWKIKRKIFGKIK
jgi:hypothetical protein